MPTSAIGLGFDRLCEYLATRGGGYTLWIGAGAAMASTGGRTPSWGQLVSDLSQGLNPLPDDWSVRSYQAKLDHIASRIGHVAFRRELRRRIVDAVLQAPLDMGVMLDQATIAARASVVVSFNIEMITAVPFAIAKGGGFFRPRPYMATKMATKPMGNIDGPEGCAMVPVYFPHGLLDMFGGCVITESEYGEHSISLAVDTAVSACMGGDVLILGMSMADRYLRDAIVRGRRWMSNVLWVTSDNAFGEWARVADVEVVHATHTQVWRGIAQACLDSESAAVARGAVSKRELNEKRQILGNGSMKKAVDAVTAMVASVPSEVDRIAQALAAVGSPYRPRDFRNFVRQTEDLGIDVPAIITQDPRYRPTDSLAEK